MVVEPSPSFVEDDSLVPFVPSPSGLGFLGSLGPEPVAELRYEAREPDSDVTSNSQSDFPVEITTYTILSSTKHPKVKRVFRRMYIYT